MRSATYRIFWNTASSQAFVFLWPSPAAEPGQLGLTAFASIVPRSRGAKFDERGVK